MAINIMLYSGIQRLCVLTRAMGSCMVNNCMASAMKYISGQVLVIRSVKSLSSGISVIILLHEKFLPFDWLRAVVFQLNLKYLHVKITTFCGQ